MRSFERIACLCGLLCSLLGLSSAGAEEARCLETCRQSRQENIRDYEKCAERAGQIKDRLMAVKHRTNCRKQYPLLECDALAPCGQAVKAAEAKAGASSESMTMGALEIVGGKGSPAHFAPKQDVEIRYLVKINKSGLPNLWFDQQVTVFDMRGNQVLELQDTFERSGEMVTSYNFKSSFTIPEDLLAGQYRIKIQTREKFSHWQGSQEGVFSVAGKAPKSGSPKSSKDS